MIPLFLVRNVDLGEVTCDGFLCTTNDCDLVSSDVDSIYIIFALLSQENGLLHVPKGQTQNVQAQMFSDPNMAMDMMKKNLSMIIPQVYIFRDCYIHY